MGIARVTIENLGPFEHAEIELKPLTIFVGRNDTGKSFLVQLLWSLTMLDSGKVREVLKKSVIGPEIEWLTYKILERIELESNIRYELSSLVLVYLEKLPEIIIFGLPETLQRVFQISVSELIREGADKAMISIRGSHAELGISFDKSEGNISTVDVYYYNELYTDLVNKLDVEFLGPKLLRVSCRGKWNFIIEHRIRSPADIIAIAEHVFAWYLYEIFGILSIPQITPLVAFFPDSRGTIFKTPLELCVYPSLMAKNLSYPDTLLVDLYSNLAFYLTNNLIRQDLIRPLLDELGCFPESVFEYGTYTIYVRTWTGKRVPLFRASSSIRGMLVAVLALAAEKEPYMIIIEEPEAHLHPRAQHILTRVIAKAVNELGKIVILTTHSDIILYSLENLIMASELCNKVRELGLSESEVLDPDKVAVYLVKRDGDKSVVERLRVTSEGIPEEEFAKVTEELTNERAKILLLSEKRGGLP